MCIMPVVQEENRVENHHPRGSLTFLEGWPLRDQKFDSGTLGSATPCGLGIRKLNYITKTQYQGKK